LLRNGANPVTDAEAALSRLHSERTAALTRLDAKHLDLLDPAVRPPVKGDDLVSAHFPETPHLPASQFARAAEAKSNPFIQCPEAGIAIRQPLNKCLGVFGRLTPHY
jgi:hypothetical protein